QSVSFPAERGTSQKQNGHRGTSGHHRVEDSLRDPSHSLRMTKQRKAYARAGVDVDLGNRLKGRIQTLVRQTHGPQVLGKIGGFGGLFRANFRSMRDPILVSSIDSVGTKLKIAFALDRHDTV